MKYNYPKSGKYEKNELKDIHIYQNDYINKILYLLKKRSPNNIYFFIIFILLKFLGNLIISHNFFNNDNSAILEINNYLRQFTFFNKFN